MARPDPQQGLMPSMLDRLIDPESAGTAWRRGYGEEQVVAAVLRDLEDMLNTRPAYEGPADEYLEVQQSIVAFGLPDLGMFATSTADQRTAIGQALETVIQRFEPRLRDVSASLLEAGDSRSRTVRFRINAKLNMDPSPEVSFETVGDLLTGRYSVQAAGS
jgi:type VI secretion system protein ImpF